MRALVCCLIAGCSAVDVRVVAAPQLGSAAALIVARLDASGAPVSLEARDALPDPWTIDDDGVPLRILSFARPLDAEIDLGALAPLPAATSMDQAWPLPTPSSGLDLAPGAGAFTSWTIDPAWLSSFRVPRPACPPLPSPRTIFGADKGLTFMLRFGDDVVAGQLSDPPIGARLLRLRPGSSRFEAFAELPNDDLSPHGAAAYVEGDRLHVLWSRRWGPPSYERIVFDASYTEVERHPFQLDGPSPNREVIEIAARGHTVVARVREIAGENDFYSRLVLFDAAAEGARELFHGPEGSSTNCGGAQDSLVLEIDGEGTGLAGLLDQPIRRFDAQSPDGIASGRLPFLGDTECRNAHARLADGAEMLTYEGSTSDKLAWAEPGGGFAVLPTTAEPSGKLVRALGNLALVDGSAETILVYQHAPERPEVPPRLCGAVYLGLGSYFGFALDDTSAIVGGDGGEKAAILSL